VWSDGGCSAGGLLSGGVQGTWGVDLGDERGALPRVRVALLLGRGEIGDEVGAPPRPDDREQLVGLRPAERVEGARAPRTKEL